MPSHDAINRSSHQRSPLDTRADRIPVAITPTQMPHSQLHPQTATLVEGRNAARCPLLPAQSTAWTCRCGWTRVEYLRGSHGYVNSSREAAHQAKCRERHNQLVSADRRPRALKEGGEGMQEVGRRGFDACCAWVGFFAGLRPRSKCARARASGTLTAAGRPPEPLQRSCWIINVRLPRHGD